MMLMISQSSSSVMILTGATVKNHGRTVDSSFLRVAITLWICLMTMCTYPITHALLSLGGVLWLADSKKVIFTSQWFGPPLSEQNDTKDLVPDRWVKI